MKPDLARLAAVEAVHRALLARWRRAMDLVGPGPLDPHFEDARGAVLPLRPTGRWADLGSGAGFPGIALAGAFPGLRVDLVESRRKRATFLERVVAEAGLDSATVVRGRVEALAPATYDGLIARAFRPPPVYLALAAPLLAEGGVAVVLTGDDAFEPPEGWRVLDDWRYRVGDGWRRARRLARAG